MPRNVNFTWKCHRETQDRSNITKVYGINAVAYHTRLENRMATGGSDGTFNFWDVKGHLRLKSFPNVGGAVTACAFDRSGSMFAYGIGYDWSKGFQHNTPDYPTKLMVHLVTEDELTRAAPTRK
jgi:mRNA export factor